MKKLYLILLGLLTACAPIKQTITHQYKITAFSAKKISESASTHSILISQPDAMAGYQTEQMLYTDKPYQLTPFAHSSWISPPANMLTPLMVQSLQQSHYFHAVGAGPNVDKTEYRLDTQLIGLQQNFLIRPSVMELTIQAVLTRVSENHMVASRTFVERIPCPSDTPYGGVIAANKATKNFTEKLTRYVIQQIQQD